MLRVFHKKTICCSALPAFKSLRRIFALSIHFCIFDMCEVSYLVEKQLEIIFNDSSDWGHIHVLSICLADLFRFIPPYPFLDSYNQLLWSISAWYFTPRMIFRCTKLFKSFHYMVNCGFCHLQKHNNLWVCSSRN